MNKRNFYQKKIVPILLRFGKKLSKKLKWLVVYEDFIIRLNNAVVPYQAIGLAIPPQISAIMRSINSNVGLSKKEIITQIMKEMPAEIDFTKREIDQLYNLSIECINNSLSQEELITKISHMRGGSFINIVAAFKLISAIVILLTNGGLSFQPNPNPIIPSHLQWLYENQQPGNHFAYGKGARTRSITITELT